MNTNGDETTIHPIPESCDWRELVDHVNEIGRQLEEAKTVVLALASSHAQLLEVVQKILHILDASQKAE